MPESTVTNPVAIPRELEPLKERQVWGLFEYPDKVNKPHKKLPIMLDRGTRSQRRQSCLKPAELWDYKTATDHMAQHPDSYALAVSLPLVSQNLRRVIRVVDLDLYKEGFDKDLLDDSLATDTFIDWSPSGGGYHLWYSFNIEPRFKADKKIGVDNISGWITLSGNVFKDHPIMTHEVEVAAVHAGDRYGELGLLNGDQVSAIYLYNLIIPIEEELEACGFTEIRRRWLSPESGTNNPGGIVFPSTNNPYDLFYTSNETGLEWIPRDPVTGNKIAIDAFELFAYRKHGGDKQKAAGWCLQGLPGIDIESGELLRNSSLWETNKSLRPVAPPIPDSDIDKSTEDNFSGILTVAVLPDDVLAPDDLFGEMVRTIDSSRFRPNLMAAFIATLGTIAYMGGGKYCGRSKKDRLRMYALGVGEPSAGKGTIVEEPSALLSLLSTLEPSAQGCDLRVYNSFASPEALEDSLVSSADLLFTWDEFGHALVEANSDVASRRAQILKYLLELWPIPHQTKRQRPKAGSEGVPIHAPHPVVIGASTESRLAEGVNINFINDGYAARFLMWPLSAYRKELRRTPEDMTLSRSLATNLAAIYSVKLDPHMMPGPVRVNNPQRIVWSNQVDDYFFSKSLEADKLPSGSLQLSLSGRKMINVKAMAMCRALINDPGNPEVTLAIAEWANRIVDQSILYQYRLFNEKAFASPTDAAEKAVLARLKRSAGKYVNAKALCDLGSMKKLNPAMRWSVIDQVVNVHDEVDRYISKNGRGKETKLFKFEEL